MAVEPKYDWVEAAKTRGLDDALGVALDALEPLGPLGAQLLWVLQPALGLFIARATVSDIAQALEAPGGIERIREQLEESSKLQVASYKEKETN
jgi:hypothetical protein